MSDRRVPTTFGKAAKGSRIPDRDSQFSRDENRRAYEDGSAAADKAFGNFGELLAKELKKRNK